MGHGRGRRGRGALAVIQSRHMGLGVGPTCWPLKQMKRRGFRTCLEVVRGLGHEGGHHHYDGLGLPSKGSDSLLIRSTLGPHWDGTDGDLDSPQLGFC